ncbi:MAG: tRNA (adenosine(37)-N6)-dimethylallyltransferase MiaA [Burkholderiaceae bacterium]|nr:tRNA (adenosine(37)-N6)-dimethylallyltransferase MiaA [Aquabacterium sp.]NUP87694.1 tRNA (adenosine(37)-N6)-dimethylallyltransferase MiaA [Burkholderiaceae bacterium]
MADSAQGSPLIALVGPTASGKSALAMALAERWPLEVISVDSALVYCGMDIGTAKPSAAERARVPHHLIDILDPAQAYSAAQFVADVTRLVPQIRARGRMPLLVGGTMLYVRALQQGLDPLPPADATVRAELDARARALGWPALHAELARVDPITAARLAPNDAQRVQRALEVWHLCGRPLSSLHGQQPGAWPDLRLVGLVPASRTWLHDRIARRLDEMVAAGFLDEVAALRARGDLNPNLPSMRCVGYRQAWEALDNGETRTLQGRAVAATRQLAKRQLTWLRSMAHEPIACDGPAAEAELIDRVATWVRRS